MFDEWRGLERSKSDTFTVYDTFIHRDMMTYVGFHAFDKQNYLRMIPYHFVDLQTFSSDVIDFCS